MTDIGTIERLPTGINGFDQVALGGLPSGRPTLVSGTTGSGKTLFAVEFLARGILDYRETGVFVTFEETPQDIRRNCASLGFPIEEWEASGQWAFVDATDDVPGESPVVGAYDFGALVARIEHVAGRIGARRLSLDSLAAIFSQSGDTAIMRRETRRIARMLRELGITSVVTAERAREYDGVARYGLDEFVLDNVIILRNVRAEEERRRTIEIVKFRGAPHRTGEWLFTIDPRDGIVIIPIAFLAPPFPPASMVRVSSGNADLDRMCGGGLFKDSVVLLAGPTGAGKTLASMQFIRAGVVAGEKCLAFTFDETREQLQRNATGWGFDLKAEEESGQLRVICDYPEVASLEDHFLRIRQAVEEFNPERIVIDTLSALERKVSYRALLTFMIALTAVVRQRCITTLLTYGPVGRYAPSTEGEIASLPDVVITLRYLERGGEILRAIAVVHYRGSAHDNTVRLVTVDGDGMHIGEPVGATVEILAGAPDVPTDADPPGRRGSGEPGSGG